MGKKSSWIKKVSALLVKKAGLNKSNARSYAFALSESYYHEEYCSPEETVDTDLSYWN